MKTGVFPILVGQELRLNDEQLPDKVHALRMQGFYLYATGCEVSDVLGQSGGVGIAVATDIKRGSLDRSHVLVEGRAVFVDAD